MTLCTHVYCVLNLAPLLVDLLSAAYKRNILIVAID